LKVKTCTCFNPGIQHLGLYPVEIHACKDTYTNRSIAALFIKANILKNQMSIQTNKLWYFSTRKYYALVKQKADIQVIT
jgi:hypothetical protein